MCNVGNPTDASRVHCGNRRRHAVITCSGLRAGGASQAVSRWTGALQWCEGARRKARHDGRAQGRDQVSSAASAPRCSPQIGSTTGFAVRCWRIRWASPPGLRLSCALARRSRRIWLLRRCGNRHALPCAHRDPSGPPGRCLLVIAAPGSARSGARSSANTTRLRRPFPRVCGARASARSSELDDDLQQRVVRDPRPAKRGQGAE